MEVALVFKFYSNRPLIIMQSWEQSVIQQASRSGIHAARRTHGVTTSRVGNTTNTTGDLSLPFDKLVGRCPDPVRGEGDLVISCVTLTALAERLWEFQNLI